MKLYVQRSDHTLSVSTGDERGFVDQWWRVLDVTAVGTSRHKG